MDKSKIIKMLKNFKSGIFLFCHSRAGGNPELANNTLDSRLRGNDRGNASTRKSSAFRKLTANSYKLKANEGFAMLFSVLISSLLVVIGLSIFNITLKELTISTSSRESQIAFYAANSGMECALYWDLKGNGSRSAFASTTSDKSSAFSVPAVCNTVTVNGNVTSSNSNSATTEFEFNVFDSNGPCANVTVEKRKITENGIDKIETTIESQGKNICGTSGRRVERGLRASITTEM